MSTTCPAGHTSTATDYCDVCGVPIPVGGAAMVSATNTPGPAGTTPSADAAPAALACPNCSVENPPDALFCEACGYDFTTGTLPRDDAEEDETPTNEQPAVGADGLPIQPDPGANPLDVADQPAVAAPAGNPLDVEATGDPAAQPASGDASSARAEEHAGPSTTAPAEAKEPTAQAAHETTDAPAHETADAPADAAVGARGVPPDQVAAAAATGLTGPSASLPSDQQSDQSADQQTAAPDAQDSQDAQDAVDAVDAADAVDTPPPSTVPPSSTASAGGRTAQLTWVAEVWVDPDWYRTQNSPDPLPSPGLPDVVPLRGRSILVGRVSTSRNIHPEIECGSDSGVSRRHAQLSTDGSRWWVEDLQSSNGTFVAPAAGPLPTDPISPAHRTQLDPDDRVYVGGWTRIVIRRATEQERAST